MRKKTSLGTFVVCLVVSLAARAHHSSAIFDPNSPVSITGTVTRMEWTNPHARLYVETRGPGGTSVEWEFELPAVNRLLRLHWTRHALQAGDQVTVTGARARHYPNIAVALNVIDATGRKLFVGTPGATEPGGTE